MYAGVLHMDDTMIPHGNKEKFGVNRMKEGYYNIHGGVYGNSRIVMQRVVMNRSQ
jgi:hypothetical protein